MSVIFSSARNILVCVYVLTKAATPRTQPPRRSFALPLRTRPLFETCSQRDTLLPKFAARIVREEAYLRRDVPNTAGGSLANISFVLKIPSSPGFTTASRDHPREAADSSVSLPRRVATSRRETAKVYLKARDTCSDETHRLVEGLPRARDKRTLRQRDFRSSRYLSTPSRILAAQYNRIRVAKVIRTRPNLDFERSLLHDVL